MKKYGIIFGVLFSIPVFAQELQSTDLIGTAIIPPEQPIMYAPEPKKIALTTISYTWSDFLQSISCADDFNKLQQTPFLSLNQKLLVDKMKTYCVGKITIWDTLLSLFRQNKKILLIDKTVQKNGSLMGHVKAIPYYLFDVHNLQPTDLGLSAKLDKIQNAIQSKNPEQVVQLMQDLSPNEQLFFMPLFNEVNSLIDFKNALQGGGDND